MKKNRFDRNFPPINSSKGGQNSFPVNPRPAPPLPQRHENYAESTEYRQKKLIDAIEREAKRPTCMSYDYDPIPSGEDRLLNILGMIENYKADL